MTGTSSIAARSESAVSARDLAPVGPLGRIDRAFTLIRRGGAGPLLSAWSAGAMPALALLALYYLEEVEGVRGVRPLAAATLTLSWLGRSVVLSRVSRTYALQIWPGLAASPPTRALDVVRTASVVALGLWLWLWPLVGASWLGALAVGLVFPVFALRGAGGPSWLARASCAPEAGWAAASRAFADGDQTRAGNVLTELLLILGAYALLLNTWASVGVISLVGHSFLGLELALVDSFLSPRNDLTVMVVTALALIAFEPLRAALSAVAFVDGRVRREGLDLRAAVDEAIGPATPAKAARAVAATLVLTLALSASMARAQEPAPPDDSAPDPSAFATPPTDAPDAAATERAQRDSVHDREAGLEAAQILAGPEFVEFEHTERESLGDLLERLLNWIFSEAPDAPDGDLPVLPQLALPGLEVFLTLALIFAGLVALFLIIARLRRDAVTPVAALDAEAKEASQDPRERAPDDWLVDARALSARGEHRLALRALYLAVLVSLDRRGLIEFDPARTNWQYLRKMPDGEARRALRELTRVFDHKWYGHESTSAEDFEVCLSRAAALVEGGRA